MEYRLEMKRLEQDLVDAYQLVETGGRCCCCTEGRPMFLYEQSRGKQTPHVRPLFMEAKRGRKTRVDPGMPGQASRYAVPEERGNEKNVFIDTGCTREKKERLKRQCVSV